MKILLITPYFPPEVGSAAHLFYELGQALKGRGHEVLVLTGQPRYHVAEPRGTTRRRLLVREHFQGLRVWRVFNLEIPWNVPVLRGLDQFASAFLTLLAGLSLPAFDVALVYSPPLPLALAALGLGRLRRRPVVVNVQDLFPQSAVDLGVLRQPQLIRMFKKLESWVYGHADLLTVHSPGNRRYIINAGANPERVTVLPNWIDTAAIRPGPRHNGLRAALGLNDQFVVAFAGIMGYSQDLETVLKSARLLKDQADIVFLMVGDGVEKPKLVEFVKINRLDKVIFLPMQPKAKYPEVLAASDLCLATLRPEVRTPVVPSKLLSIMAAGRPVLASLPLDGDAPRLINEAGCGVVIPPAEPNTMARAILDLYQDAERRGQMGRQARQYAEQHLSVAAVAGQLEGILRQVGNY
ncbi:MAG: glycosyltransferase family 4 protein [Desulfobacca sp.]|nr:glycosyltransferase family 4 protein [Desulfobacca sp.]